MFYETEEDSDGNITSVGAYHDMVSSDLRLQHVELLKPEICSLDCGTLNFGSGSYVSTAAMLRDMAPRITEAGIKAELECFEIGHTALATQLYALPHLFATCNAAASAYQRPCPCTAARLPPPLTGLAPGAVAGGRRACSTTSRSTSSPWASRGERPRTSPPSRPCCR